MLTCDQDMRCSLQHLTRRPSNRDARGRWRAFARSPLLLGVLGAACCAPTVETRRDPPSPVVAPPKREPVRFTESGCVVGGVEYGPDRAFTYEGKLCGCYEGKLSCNEASEARCFRDGQWYGEGISVTLNNPWRRCDCPRAPAWECREQRLLIPECPKVMLPRVMNFELGSSALTVESQQRVEKLADQLKRDPHARVTLQAHADPSEEPRASWIAQRRAEMIQTALVKLGVERSRIDIVNLGAKPVPGPPNLPSCSDTSALNPGPFVVIGTGEPKKEKR